MSLIPIWRKLVAQAPWLGRWIDAVRFFSGSLVQGYAQVYFTNRPWMGVVLLLCTLIAPWYGLVGLAGTAIALLAGLALGVDREQLRGGGCLTNSLLVALAVAHLGHTCALAWPTLALLLVVAPTCALLLSIAMSNWLRRQCGLPALSLPFVGVHFLLYFLAAYTLKWYPQPTFLLPAIDVGQGYWKCYLESFGAITFVSHTTVGLLVLLALLCYSRLAVLYATAGFIAGMAALAASPFPVAPADASYIAFNFVFCGVALGGICFVPSLGSLLLAMAGSVCCALLAVAEINFLGAMGVPPMALAFNVVTLLAVYALQQRTKPRQPHASNDFSLPPEETLRKFMNSRLRFPDAHLPSIRCPFAGERVVTQAFDGPLTHRGDWRYALDFEVRDERGDPAAPSHSRLDDFFTFGTPVLAPEAGVVARTVSHVEDRAAGASNYGENWGNVVILRLDSGLYASLCHLRQGSIKVHEGQRVEPGELLGHCGNSGRSPLPHLHVQLQTTPAIGATTLPFRLRHYLEETERGRVYRTLGVPDCDARIHDTVLSRRVAECFDNIGRRTFRYHLRDGDRQWSEDVAATIDELGNYAFRSSRGGVLTARVIDGAFYALDYRARGESLLDWLWLGLCRVPLIEGDDVHWHDALSVQPYLTRWSTPLTDVVALLAGLPSIRVESRFISPTCAAFARADVALLARADRIGQVPLRCEIPAQLRIGVSKRDWIVDIVAEFAGRQVTAELLDPE